MTQNKAYQHKQRLPAFLQQAYVLPGSPTAVARKQRRRWRRTGRSAQHRARPPPAALPHPRDSAKAGGGVPGGAVKHGNPLATIWLLLYSSVRQSRANHKRQGRSTLSLSSPSSNNEKKCAYCRSRLMLFIALQPRKTAAHRRRNAERSASTSPRRLPGGSRACSWPPSSPPTVGSRSKRRPIARPIVSRKSRTHHAWATVQEKKDRWTKV